MKKWIQNLSLTLISILLTLFCLEIIFRVSQEKYTVKNYLEEKKALLHSSYPVQFDPQLGWMPRIGFSGNRNFWDTQVTILAEGIRSNGTRRDLLPKGKILAIGDSYTFGDQVSNHETWPALLEKSLGEPVLNGGVFGYGLDQSYLRARQLVASLQPETVIFSFIPDDITRCGLAARTSAVKPYFSKEEGGLRLHQEHLKPPETIGEIKGIRKILGYSYFMHSLMHQVAPVYWYEGKWKSLVAHQDSEWVACQLLQQLESDLQKTSVKQLVILAQYPRSTAPEDYEKVNRVLNCLENPDTQILNLKNVLQKVKKQSPGRYRKFFTNHMTQQGNYFVAQQLEKVIQTGHDLAKTTHSKVMEK